MAKRHRWRDLPGGDPRNQAAIYVKRCADCGLYRLTNPRATVRTYYGDIWLERRRGGRPAPIFVAAPAGPSGYPTAGPCVPKPSRQSADDGSGFEAPLSGGGGSSARENGAA